MNAWTYFEGEFIQNIYFDSKELLYAPIAFNWGAICWYSHCGKSSQSCMRSGCNGKEAIECWPSTKYVLCYRVLKYCALLLSNLLTHNSTEQDGINVKLSLFTPVKQVVFLSSASDGGKSV